MAGTQRTVPLEIDEAVQLVAYHPAWPRWFAEEASVVRATLGATLDDLQHIGSTAVPGLPAKPIIDLQGALHAFPAGRETIATLEPLGYEYLGEAGVPGRQYFRKRGARNFNLHLLSRQSEHWANNLLLRDYLRAWPDEAQHYARHKQAIVARGAARLLAYSDQKHDYLSQLLHRARAWRQAG